MNGNTFPTYDANQLHLAKQYNIQSVYGAMLSEFENDMKTVEDFNKNRYEAVKAASINLNNAMTLIKDLGYRKNTMTKEQVISQNLSIDIQISSAITDLVSCQSMITTVI